jgi:hypothetical protein
VGSALPLLIILRSDKMTELMKLQGKIRVVFMSMGIDEDKALDLAAEALHLFLISEVAKDDYRAIYQGIDKI